MPAASLTVPVLVLPSPQVNRTVCVAPGTVSVNVPDALTVPPSAILPGETSKGPTGSTAAWIVAWASAAAPGPTSSVDVAVMVSIWVVCPGGRLVL